MSAHLKSGFVKFQSQSSSESLFSSSPARHAPHALYFPLPDTIDMLIKIKIAWQLGLGFAFIVAICFAIYWPGLIALPRYDHFSILNERQFYDNDVDFFLNGLSFSRTRHTAQGDVFLFRPGTMGLLVAQDIYFRANLYVLGTLSILWHAISVFLAYLILQKLKIGAVATYSLLAILLVQYPGMDMILWRHISPYLFAVSFFSLGLLVLLRAEHRALELKDSALISGCFFLSTLFHELLVFALPFAFVLTIFTQLRNRLGLRFLAIILLLPSVCYMAVNVMDFLLRGSPSILGPSDSNMFNLRLTDFLYLPGVFLYQFIFPWLVELESGSLRGRAIWPFNEALGAGFLFPYLGALLLTFLGLILSGLRYVLNRDEGFYSMRCFLIVLILSSFASLFGGLLVGRVALRGMSYMENSTYYFYIFNYFFVLIVGLAFSIYWHWISKQIQEYKLRILAYNKTWLNKMINSVSPLMSAYSIVIIVTCFILADLMVMNRFIQGANLKEDTLMAKATLWVSNISKKREYCYMGSMVAVVPEVLLYRESCNVKKGIPLILQQKGGGLRQKGFPSGLRDKSMWRPSFIRPDKDVTLELVDQTSGNVISTYHVNISDMPAPPRATLSEMEQKLIGSWGSLHGKTAHIYLDMDGNVIAANENGARDQLVIKEGAISAAHWKVKPSLSDDGKSLVWGNGAAWTRYVLSEVGEELIGKWYGANGENHNISYVSDNLVIAVNEDGTSCQLKIEGNSIIPIQWKVQPSLSDDGKSLNWGNGTVWTR